MIQKKTRLPMNLPNRLTLLRIAMIPLYLVLLTGSAGCRIGAALVFAAASITDFFDGRIARNRNLITDFGKFMDPIADKLLVLLPFLYFCATEPFGVADVWPVMLMVAREIIVSGFRLVASTKGKVIAADKFGKVKTAVQMVTVIAMTLRPIIESAIPWFGKIPWALLWLCGVLSVYSGAEMIRKNLHILEVEE